MSPRLRRPTRHNAVVEASTTNRTLSIHCEDSLCTQRGDYCSGHSGKCNSQCPDEGRRGEENWGGRFQREHLGFANYCDVEWPFFLRDHLCYVCVGATKITSSYCPSRYDRRRRCRRRLGIELVIQCKNAGTNNSWDWINSNWRCPDRIFVGLGDPTSKQVTNWRMKLKKPWGVWLTAGVSAAAAMLAAFVYVHASHLATMPYDGPFQTLYSLRKLDAGYMSGRDFFFFHGNGIPYIHYPFFKLLGSNLFAFQAAESLVHIVCVLLPIYFSIRIYFGKAEAAIACLGWIIVSATSFGPLPLASLLSVFASQSTLGLRTVAVFASAYFVATAMTSDACSRRQWALLVSASFTAAIAVLLGTEHGFYTICAGGVLIFLFRLYQRKLLSSLVQSVCFTFVSLLFVGMLHMILFGTLAALTAIGNVQADQAWYFGVYPHLFIRYASDLVKLPHGIMSLYKLLGVVTILTIAFFVFQWRKWSRDMHMLLYFSFLYIQALSALSSNMGYVSFHYGVPLLRVDYLLLMVSLLFWTSGMKTFGKRQ
jgi:hypothetical protein